MITCICSVVIMVMTSWPPALHNFDILDLKSHLIDKYSLAICTLPNSNIEVMAAVCTSVISCNWQRLKFPDVSAESMRHRITLRKHAYSNILKILPPKNDFFSDKNYIFYISAQNIHCGYSLEPPRRGGSNEYHNLCFWEKIRKIMYTPVNPSFII